MNPLGNSPGRFPKTARSDRLVRHVVMQRAIAKGDLGEATQSSYNFVHENLESAHKNLLAVLSNLGLPVDEVAQVDVVPEPAQILGLVQHATRRASVLINPMQLDKMPPGHPGTVAYEAEKKGAGRASGVRSNCSSGSCSAWIRDPAGPHAQTGRQRGGPARGL